MKCPNAIRPIPYLRLTTFYYLKSVETKIFLLYCYRVAGWLEGLREREKNQVLNLKIDWRQSDSSIIKVYLKLKRLFKIVGAEKFNGHGLEL